MLGYPASKPLQVLDLPQVSASAHPATRPGLISLLFALLVSSLAGVAQADDPKPADAKPQGPALPPAVVIVQESNGFPGGERATRLAPQRVAVQGSHLRVLDPTHGYALYVDLAKKEVFEVDVSRKEYVHRPFAYYEKYRDQRNKTLDDQKNEFVQGLKRREGKVGELRSWKNEYRKIGGDPEAPGKLVARLQHYANESKKITLLVDREPKEVTVEHYVIRENQADRPIFDLWVTRDVELPVDLFRFYRELGTFSKPVTDKLLELKGTIVHCDAVLDTGTFFRVFKTRVKEIRHERPTLAPVFTPKPPFTKVDPDAKKVTVGSPTKGTIKCAQCGETIEGKVTEFREPWGKRRRFPLCGADCRRKLIRKLVAERKKGN